MACLLILNFSARSKFSLVQAAVVISLTCSAQLQLLVNVKPKCLYDEASVIGGCRGGLRFKYKIWEIVFEALKSTSHCAAMNRYGSGRDLKWWLQCSSFSTII